MAATFYIFFLFLCLRTSFAEEVLLPPQNVTVISLNDNYTLSWDWDRDQRAAQGHSATFTTQYGRKFHSRKSAKWYTVCDQSSHMSCDLTKRNLHYLGIYVIRVRADVNDGHSPWVETVFHPDKDAALGPPTKVNIGLVGTDLEVYISDPMTSHNTSMREKIETLYFHLIYWERFADPKALLALDTTANVVNLPNLKPWTWYCVRVQSRSDIDSNKHSTFTSPLCLQTEGSTPWWQILLYFGLSLVICFLIVLPTLYGLFWCYKIWKSTWYPSVQLPSYLNDYICESPQSDMPKLLTPDSKSELVCDRVTVSAEPALLEIHSPPPEERFVNYPLFEPDSSGRHSRQSSGGSEDSGVYSTKSSSGLKQLSSCQSEESWRTPCDPELVKLHDVDPGLENRRLIIDEGIVDVSV